MTMQTLYAGRLAIPPLDALQLALTASGTITLDATGEMGHYSGQVYLAAGSGSKTISSVGGKIHWRSGNTNTFANAGTTFRIGIQDVSTTTAPAQGDGTHDVYADLVGGTDTIASTTAYATAMEVGTKTIAHGDKVSIVWDMVSRAGADTLTLSIHSSPNGSDGGFPAFTSYLAAAWAKVNSSPLCAIEFDDGTFGWIFMGAMISTSSTAQTFNLATATADEYGNFLQLDFTTRASGLYISGYPTGTAADFEVILYSDPLGTPAIVEAITYDATQEGTIAGARYHYLMFSTPRTLTAGTAYAVTIRPTTANNVTTYYFDVPAAGLMDMYPLGRKCYAIRRLDNTGAFTDYNGGTAKTRRFAAGIIAEAFDDGAGGAGGLLTHPGMSGGMRG